MIARCDPLPRVAGCRAHSRCAGFAGAGAVRLRRPRRAPAEGRGAGRVRAAHRARRRRAQLSRHRQLPDRGAAADTRRIVLHALEPRDRLGVAARAGRARDGARLRPRSTRRGSCSPSPCRSRCRAAGTRSTSPGPAASTPASKACMPTPIASPAGDGCCWPPTWSRATRDGFCRAGTSPRFAPAFASRVELPAGFAGYSNMPVVAREAPAGRRAAPGSSHRRRGWRATCSRWSRASSSG